MGQAAATGPNRPSRGRRRGMGPAGNLSIGGPARGWYGGRGLDENRDVRQRAIRRYLVRACAAAGEVILPEAMQVSVKSRKRPPSGCFIPLLPREQLAFESLFGLRVVGSCDQ